MDTFLGKEVVQNLPVLRFGNIIFDPLWNRTFVKCIQIIWKDDRGIEGKGSYFDQSGIIRDVMVHVLHALRGAFMFI